MAKGKLESIVARLERLRDATWNELQGKQWAALFEYVVGVDLKWPY